MDQGRERMRKEYMLRRCCSPLIAVFLFPALGGLLFGYDIGCTSYVLDQLQTPESGVRWAHSIADSALLRGFFPASGVGGALLGTIIVFRFADKLGRRRELLIGATLYSLGGFLEWVSSLGGLAQTETWGLIVVLVGRWVYGVACGFSMHGAPAYLAEMTPPSIRGFVVSAKEAAIVLGILLGQAVGYAFLSHTGAWRWAYGLSVPVAVVMFSGMYMLPSSARWLALHGMLTEAEDSLRFFMSPEDVGEAMAEIRKQAQQASRRKAHTSLFVAKYRWQLIVGIGVVTLQQITGQPSVLYYAQAVFKQANFADGATLAVGAFKLLSTLIAVVTVDKLGRRGPLLTGIVLMLAALITLAVVFHGYNPGGSSEIDTAKILIVVSMFIYIGGYQVGFGPIAWTLISEIFGLDVRGQAVAFAVSANFFWNLVVTFLFPELQERMGSSATFGLFAAIDALAFFFVLFFVPETKGLSLEAIQAMFAGRGPAVSGRQHAHSLLQEEEVWGEEEEDDDDEDGEGCEVKAAGGERRPSDQPLLDGSLNSNMV